MNTQGDTLSLDALLDAASDVQGQASFIQALTSSRIWVIADRDWDGHHKPAQGTQILMVNDGADHSKSMVAVFTSRSHADTYLNGVKDTVQGFRHPAEPPMAWVLLGLSPGSGIMVNPGSPRAVRVTPDIATKLRRDAEATLMEAQTGSRSPEQIPLLLKIQQLIDADDIAGAESGIAELAKSAIQREYVLASRALVAKYRSEYDEAKELLQQAVNLSQDSKLAAEFWWLLSQVNIDAQDPEAAEAAFRRAIDLDPRRIEYLTDLAHFLSDRGDTDGAIALLHEAARHRPDEPTLPLHIGQLLMEAGRHEEALTAFEELAVRHPAHTAASWHNRAVCLQILGRLDEAKSSLERALTLDPNLNGHHQYVNLIKTTAGNLPASAKYIELLQMRTGDDMPVNSRIDSYFTLARIHESAGDYSRAFECMQRANTLKRSTVKWSLGDAEMEFEKIINLIDRDFIARYRGRVATGLKPVFVLGMPRSGTTLTEQILAAHSNINAGGELTHLTRLGMPFVETWSKAGYLATEKQQDCIAALALIAERYSVLTAGFQTAGTRFTDKMPGNFMLLGLIYLLFPGASVVHCMRNPVDNCLSCFERHFSKGQFFSYDMRELAGYYRLYRRIMRHWREMLPQEFILDLQYEELVSAPEPQIRRLLEFCNLPFEDACMNFHEVKRSVKTASSLQVRQPMYKTSVARWKKYGDRLQPLIEALGPELGGR